MEYQNTELAEMSQSRVKLKQPKLNNHGGYPSSPPKLPQPLTACGTSNQKELGKTCGRKM